MTSEGSTRLRDVARQGKRPRWFIPTGIAALLGAIVLAITLLPGKKPTPTDSEVKKEEPKIALNTETDPPKKDVPKIEVQQPIVHGQETTYDLGNGVKLEMIKINAKGKTFMMGSPKKEPNRAAFQTFDPEDQHEVTFGHDFSMGKYEVTQEQYEAIMGKNPSQFKGPKRPVERVLWNDAQDFIKKLNDRMKGNAKFRLPSEAEWEYACRAGTTTAYNTGNSLTSDDAHFGVTIDVGTKLVGIYKPNKFGLYDMHGNVAEWCEDYYGDYKNAPKNGTAQRSIQSNDYRALRGGVWNYFVRDCRSACRYISTADISSFNFGFRLVASQDEPIEINKADPLLPPITKGDETTYDLGNGVKLEMIKINAKGKKFLMGSPKEEEGRPNGDFEEQHEITFGHDFSIGKYEVTQEQYEAIMGYNPAQFKGVNRPVEKVLWNDAQEFIRKLNEKVKGKAKFRLPSEAEWEYACRAGTTTPFHFGKELNGKQANCDGNTPYGTAEKGPYLKETTSVGTYKPNDFGLYDMHGNVFEWCEDYWGLYKIAPTDGTAQKVKTPNDNRVLRGGTWFIPPQYCRSALRFIITPLIRVEGIGFRVVATQDEPIEVKKADPPAQPITKGE
ncbi:MAG: formylglycine-generating enzyme family protein [Planctomycetes bacterium]|nr:formylglycine-generating enzyme family protein [Planctomycetota bacterium]